MYLQMLLSSRLYFPGVINILYHTVSLTNEINILSGKKEDINQNMQLAYRICIRMVKQHQDQIHSFLLARSLYVIYKAVY